ncbi:hypothetical protein MSAN_00969700 [Mycena sanguinolenta]|uniref:Uncharacterized protein n=1 Tax=Mycena sanguinolenta TaxID=230812 RepID=A0A8H6YY51_9AGAR|nr:hypothetical protein MSAN_00969700 [Mycena sanguinolenta]
MALPRLATASPTPSSPSDSPSLSASGSSVSSFPSVSSSFFFSSAAASPPHEAVVPGPLSVEVEETLIIPSLTLPAPLLRRKEARGPITRLLVLGPPDVATAALCVDNPDADTWIEEDGFRVLRASIPSQPASGDQAESDSVSLELVALGEDINQLDVPATANLLLTPFRRIAALLAPPLLSSAQEEEELLTALLSGPEVPLYMALLVVSPSSTASSQSPAASVSNSAILPADIAVDIGAIPESISRFVPVISLVPEPAPPPAPPHAPSGDTASEAADEREDTAHTTPVPALDLDSDAPPAPSPAALALDVPPTVHIAFAGKHVHTLRATACTPLSLFIFIFTRAGTSIRIGVGRAGIAHSRRSEIRAVVARGRGAIRTPTPGRLWCRLGSPSQFRLNLERKSKPTQANLMKSNLNPTPPPRLVVHLPLHPHSRELTGKLPLSPFPPPPFPLSASVPAHPPLHPSPSTPPLPTTTSTPALRLLKTDLHDPLHLPSIFALVRDVVRAWSSRSAFSISSTSRSAGLDERRYNAEARWWRLGLGAPLVSAAVAGRVDAEREEEEEGMVGRREEEGMGRREEEGCEESDGRERRGYGGGGEGYRGGWDAENRHATRKTCATPRLSFIQASIADTCSPVVLRLSYRVVLVESSSARRRFVTGDVHSPSASSTCSALHHTSTQRLAKAC